MNNVRVRWIERRQFAGWDDAGHGIVMDATPESNGEGTGPRPIELVLYGLAGCTAMDVVSVLEKKRLDVRGVEVLASGVQREDGFPHSYESIALEYIVTGVDISAEAVERAIELSETKYCSVRGCLGEHVDVSWTFRVEQPAAPGPRRADERA